MKVFVTGGAGFFMFYHNGNNKEKTEFTRVLKKMNFHFDFEGAKILLNKKGL